MKKSLLAATAISIISAATSANAMMAEKNRWPYWYAGLNAGFVVTSQDDWKRTGASGEFDLDEAFTYSGSIGYQPNNFRYEVELGAADQGVGTTGHHGDINMYKLMANVIYDFNNAGGFFPFLGVGAGAVKLDVAQTNSAAISGNDTTAAYQLIAGLNLGEVFPQTNLQVDYKYLDSFSDFEIGSTDVEYNAHTVEAGLRFRF